jgi:hypothetical protein
VQVEDFFALLFLQRAKKCRKEEEDGEKNKNPFASN